MKSTDSPQRDLEKIRRLCDRENYRRAFSAVNKLRQQWPDNPEVLVLWANLLQLQEEDTGPSLEEAKKALQKAVSLDEQNPMPWNELGQYMFVIEDDAVRACHCFTKAIALSRRYLKDALINQAKALMETDHKAESMACLIDAYNVNGHDSLDSIPKNGADILEQMRELSADAHR
jgi:tetratricopeptide (TPR) repeat protein